MSIPDSDYSGWLRTGCQRSVQGPAYTWEILKASLSQVLQDHSPVSPQCREHKLEWRRWGPTRFGTSPHSTSTAFSPYFRSCYSCSVATQTCADIQRRVRIPTVWITSRRIWIMPSKWKMESCVCMTMLRPWRETNPTTSLTQTWRRLLSSSAMSWPWSLTAPRKLPKQNGCHSNAGRPTGQTAV